MSFNIKVAKLVGRSVKDRNNIRIGRVISFLMNSSGQVDTVLVEKDGGIFVEYPFEMLKVEHNEVFLLSQIIEEISDLSIKLPTIAKKRNILDDLSKKKIIPSKIYTNLCREFDASLKEMGKEVRLLFNDLNKQIKHQEEYIKKLQIAKTVLEVEHDIGTIKSEIYKQSIISLLKEIKNVQKRKISLLGIKEKVSIILNKQIKDDEKVIQQIVKEVNSEDTTSKEDNKTAMELKPI
jgi:hypothetical protein